MSANTPQELRKLYAARFEPSREYRRAVWRVLVSEVFSKHIGAQDTVLDLGCGYGEFINQVRCGRRFAMDLNPDAAEMLEEGVKLLAQDCSAPWPLEDNSLDVVFTSNFFEHLPDKPTLARTLAQAHRCLRPGGKLLAMGPNIRLVDGAYYDFWDHHIELTERSLAEALVLQGFAVEVCLGRFMPYTMSDGRQFPVFFVKLYLRLPWAWRIFGKQFLVIGRKPA